MTKRRDITLSWFGKDDSPGRAPEHEAPLRTFQTEDGSSRLVHGDNLAALRALAETHAEAVTLCYMDPPFLTGRVHEAVSRSGALGPARARQAAFDDRWSDLASYLESLGPRLRAARELLAPHGSIVIHVDSKTSHYVKVLADEVFGIDAFASEIIWRYRRWPSKTQNFQRFHDCLLRYRKDPKTPPRWTTLYEPLAASTLATWGSKKQKAVVGKDGRRERSSIGSQSTDGVPMGDVWDIGVIAPIARERTGYPSQKPEALLERLLSALTVPGDMVLDPYSGSGTTISVAARMGRTFVGIDCGNVAIDTARGRLHDLGVRLTEEPLAARRRAS